MASATTADEERFMRRAIELSQVAADKGNTPYGAVLVKDGVIIEEAHNSNGSLGGDVTAHAEMQLIRYMCGQPRFGGGRGVFVPVAERSRCTVFTSSEPCVMCAGALFWSGVGRVVMGCDARSMQEISGPGGFDLPIGELYASSDEGCRARAIVTQGPLLKEEALAVHRRFWPGRTRNGIAPPPCSKPSEEPPAKRRREEADAVVQREVQLERALFREGGAGAGAARHGGVPVIDLSQPDEVCAQAMWEAACEVGFFTVVNHGISKATIDHAFETSAAFFAQPRATKEAQSPFAKHLNSGYEFMSQVRPSTGLADQKESLQITARAGAMQGRWPTTPENFEDGAKSFSTAAHALGQRILSLLETRACPHLPQGTLARAHTLWAEDGQCTVRMPPLSACA